MEIGTRYDRSDDHTSEWFRSELADYMEHRLSGAVQASIERIDGTSIAGSLVGVDDEVIVLDVGAGDGRGVHVDDVSSLMLVAPPLDLSDELRG
jgi:hypothetical protein